MEFDINHIANLARLGLNEDEKERLAKEILVVLNYVNELNKADTFEIKPILQITGLENIMRKDEIKEREMELSKKIIDLAPVRSGYNVAGGPASSLGGPKTKRGFIKIKKIL